MGPTWMDDLAIRISSSSAEQITVTMAQVASFLLDLCAFNCLSPNLSPGKTELLLSFRGLGSRRMKTRYYGPHSTMTIPVVCEKDTKHLRLVTQYRHLGGICHHLGDQGAPWHIKPFRTTQNCYFTTEPSHLANGLSFSRCWC